MNKIVFLLCSSLFLISCGLDDKHDDIYEVFCDTLVSNYLEDSQNVFLANSVDGSAYQTARFITGEGYSKYMRQIADSLYKDSIRLNSNIVLMKELNNKLANKGFNVKVFKSFDVNELSIDSTTSMICFSKQYDLEGNLSGGYISFLNYSPKPSRGFYYGVADDSFWLDQIWSTDNSKIVINYPNSAR